MKCACGLPLHYSDRDMYRQVERMIDVAGGDQYIPVTVMTDGGWRTWRVQRHYIALHGLKAQDLPALAPRLGFKELLG